MIATVYNIFDFDWYERTFNTNGNATQYSAFLVNNDDAFEMCGDVEVEKNKLQNFLRNFNTGLLKKNIPLYINENDDSYTDGKEIMVSSLKDFKNPEQNYYWRLDTMIGLALHEACHCVFSDFNKFKSCAMNNPTIKWILNVIEDEAIENSCKNRAKGYSKFLDNVKYHYFDEKFDGNFTADNDFEEFSKIFINVIRYPKFIKTVMTHELKDKWSEIFFKIYNILEHRWSLIKVNGDITYTNTCDTKNNIGAARDIYNLIKDFLKLDDNQINDLMKGSMGKSGSATGSEATGTKPMTSAEENELIEQLNKLSNNDNNDDKNGGDSNSHGISGGRGIASNLSILPREFVKDTYAYSSLYKWAYPHLQKATSIIYNKSYKLNYERTRYNRSGQLDGANIVSALAGNKFVCNQVKENKKVENGKLALVLMSDSSGSMGLDNGRLMRTIGHFVTLFAEAIKNVPGCEVYVYTHNCNVHRVVSDKEWKQNKACIGEAFKVQYSEGCQNEVEAYTKIIEDVRKQTKLPILGINFGDSEYGACSDDIKSCVENLKKEKNCIMTMCSIGNEDTSAKNDNIYGEGNWVHIQTLLNSEIVQVIKELANIIKREYKKK